MFYSALPSGVDCCLFYCCGSVVVDSLYIVAPIICMVLCLYGSMFVWFYVCMLLCLYGSMFVWFYVCMVLCLYGSMFVWFYICMLICLYVCMSLCLYGSMFVCLFVCLFDSLRPINNLSVKQGRVFLG